MNDLSLQRANAFLAAVSQRVAVGETLQETPAEIGRDLDLPDPLSTARAVRALMPAVGSSRRTDRTGCSTRDRSTPGSAIDRAAASPEGHAQ